ncbi:MAG TPA: beta-glucosidase, partial [Bacteroidales bacterium]|nr:beta-glucosidase [Bacteroidales bacterium]
MKYFRKILIIIPLLFYPSFTLISGGKQGNFSLDDLQRRTFYYFWDLADPVTGLIPDRAPTKSFSSVAAVGFGLSSYIVGTEHGWV